MAYIALLWKARTIEKYRQNYEQEKLNSIKLAKAELPKLSVFQKLRHYRYDKQKKAGKWFQKCCPQGSKLGNFIISLRTDQTFPNFLMKSVLGFVGGIVLTYCCFMFFVFQLSISLVHATIMSCIIGILLTLGLAFSYRIRCLVFLLIPQFFSRVGRYTLTCYALVLVLTGPATNTLRNSEVLSESMACGQEQVKSSVRQITESIKKPFNSMKDTIKLMMDKVKGVAVKLKETLLKVHRLVLSIVRVLQSAFSWLSSIVGMCNKKVGTPYVRCTRALSDGVLDCQARLGPYFSWLCNVVYVAQVACWAVKPLDFICILVEFVSGTVVTTIKKKLRTFSNHVKTMLYVSVHVHHSYTFSSNSSKSASQVAAGIVTEIRHKAEPLLTWLSWSSCVTSLFLLLIIFRAKYYQHMYETRSRFDNRYITSELRYLDLKRVRENRDTVLPLNRRERTKYITTTSFRLLPTEKLYLARSLVFMCITTFKLLIHMVADYSLYWVLMTIRRHGRFQTPQLPGVPDAGVEVAGKGPVAGMMRSLVGSLSLPLSSSVPSPVSCLPNPYPPDLQRYTQIGVLIFLLWFLAIFEPYGLRLRHVIMGHYRPERAKARAVWLYNHILRTRGGFLKLARRKLHRDYKYSTEEKFTFRQWLDAHIPCWWLRALLGTSPTEPHCLLCGTIEKINDPDTQLIHCNTPNCPGIYCASCFSDIGQLCTICLSPADYGDVSDISLEKGSSEESSSDSSNDTNSKSDDSEMDDDDNYNSSGGSTKTSLTDLEIDKENTSTVEEDSETSKSVNQYKTYYTSDNNTKYKRISRGGWMQNDQIVNFTFNNLNNFPMYLDFKTSTVTENSETSESKNQYKTSNNNNNNTNESRNERQSNGCLGKNEKKYNLNNSSNLTNGIEDDTNQVVRSENNKIILRQRRRSHDLFDNLFKLFRCPFVKASADIDSNRKKLRIHKLHRKRSRRRKRNKNVRIKYIIHKNRNQGSNNDDIRKIKNKEVYVNFVYSKFKTTKAKPILKNVQTENKLNKRAKDKRLKYNYMTQDEWIRDQFNREVGLLDTKNTENTFREAVNELQNVSDKMKKHTENIITFKDKGFKVNNIRWSGAPKPARCECPVTTCTCVGHYEQSSSRPLPKMKNVYRGVTKYFISYFYKKKKIPPPSGTFIKELEAALAQEITIYNKLNDKEILKSSGPEDCLSRCPHFYRSRKFPDDFDLKHKYEEIYKDVQERKDAHYDSRQYEINDDGSLLDNTQVKKQNNGDISFSKKLENDKNEDKLGLDKIKIRDTDKSLDIENNKNNKKIKDEASFQDLVRDIPLGDGISLPGPTQSSVSLEQNKDDLNHIPKYETQNLPQIDTEPKEINTQESLLNSRASHSKINSCRKRIQGFCEWLLGYEDTKADKEVQFSEQEKLSTENCERQLAEDLEKCCSLLKTTQDESHKSISKIQEVKAPKVKYRYTRNVNAKNGIKLDFVSEKNRQNAQLPTTENSDTSTCLSSDWWSPIRENTCKVKNGTDKKVTFTIRPKAIYNK